MDDLFLLIFLLSGIAILIGLVKPAIVSLGKFNSRKQILKYYGIALIISFVLFGVFKDNPTEDIINEPKIVEKQSKGSEETSKEIADESTQETENTEQSNANYLHDDIFEGYRLIEVDGGDLSGHREPNVVVDIGFGDREYYAFTNEYGQLVKVVAKKITLQDENTEPVTSKGRYYPDEAKVPGVESSSLDEGHVIADSLGGVSNAYNITPQNSTLNRHGDQAYMEKAIREAGGCKDFIAIITYPNITTQIPNHYSFTYTLKGSVINDEFDNINPDEVNSELEEIDSSDNQNNVLVLSNQKINIVKIDKVAEIVTIKNNSSEDIDITEWIIVSVTGNQKFTFPSYVIKSGDEITVTSGKNNKNDGSFYWGKANVWNNSKDDPGELYNSEGNLIDKY